MPNQNFTGLTTHSFVSATSGLAIWQNTRTEFMTLQKIGWDRHTWFAADMHPTEGSTKRGVNNGLAPIIHMPGTTESADTTSYAYVHLDLDGLGWLRPEQDADIFFELAYSGTTTAPAGSSRVHMAILAGSRDIGDPMTGGGGGAGDINTTIFLSVSDTGADLLRYHIISTNMDLTTASAHIFVRLQRVNSNSSDTYPGGLQISALRAVYVRQST